MSDSSTEAPGSAEERSAEAGARPSVPESRRGETLPHRPTPESMVLAIYILYLIGLAVSFAAVIGLLVAYSSRAAAAVKQAMAPFMSAAPRPNSAPSMTSPSNGPAVQAPASPTGTTSVWPAKQKFGAWPPTRA